jgi:arsenate reductase
MSEQAIHSAHALRVLFLCTHNSSRSQMAEGLLRARGGSAFAVLSAGTEPRIVHPFALKAMHEIGIDISTHRAKSLDVFRDQPPMDLVITVCDEVRRRVPFSPMLVIKRIGAFLIPAEPREAKRSAWLPLAAFVIRWRAASEPFLLSLQTFP